MSIVMRSGPKPVNLSDRVDPVAQVNQVLRIKNTGPPLFTRGNKTTHEKVRAMKDFQMLQLELEESRKA